MTTRIPSFLPKTVAPSANRTGFRFGDKGTHTSRTMMLEELEAVLAATPSTAARSDFAGAIIDDNCLGKTTAATRRLSNQRLGELYGLDPSIPLFRVLHRVWALDREGRPLAALLCALARDPLLAATAGAVIPLAPGEDLRRDELRSALRKAVGERLNEAVIDKVVRNAASSWTQAGHLEGRTFKKRQKVQATPGVLALALFLGHALGFQDAELFATGWTAVLDLDAASARTLALEAKRLGLIDLRMSMEVVTIDPSRLDPAEKGA